MAITLPPVSELTNDTSNPENCKNRKATITVSVTAVGPSKRDTIDEAKVLAKELKDDKIAEMKRTIHCPNNPDICPPSFTCFEDQPWSYPQVRPGWNITPDDEAKPTEWTVIRSYLIKGTLRCECIRASLAAKDDYKMGDQWEDELEELLGD